MVKPVVSAMNAWTCIVLSVFAIVILSTIGALFKSGSHTVLGGVEDPEDGSAVAGAVFGAVFIYIVREILPRSYEKMLIICRASSSSAASRPSFTSARVAVVL